MSFDRARKISCLVLAVACLLQLTPAARAESAPSFTIVEPEIALAPGALNGRGSLLLSADKLDNSNIVKPLEDAKVLDTGLVPGGIAFDVKDIDHTDSSRRWILTADIKNLPNNVTQKRYLTFRFDGKAVTLPFTLTNKNPATFTWSVKAPAEISLPPGEPIEINVVVQGVAATKVRSASTLLEQSGKRPVEGGWMLCDKRTADPAACRNQELNLAAYSAQQLWLYPSKDATLVGKYMGNVTISATEKPEGDTQAVTVYGTNLSRQILGVIVIVAGIFLAWLLTVYLQNRLNRNQMLLPAVMLRDRFVLLREILKDKPAAATFDCQQTLLELNKSITALSEESLEANNQLPPNIPNPFKALGPNADSYKQLIAEQTSRFELLQAVVKSGFQAIWKQIPAAPNDQQRTAIMTAATKVDKISADKPPIAEALASLDEILNELKASLAKDVAAALVAATFQARTSDQIVTEIRSLSGLAWLVFALIATALGTYVVILSNLGFGTGTDYLTCLLWGFGLPIGSSQLAQSTTGSTATALGFSIPRPQ